MSMYMSGLFRWDSEWCWPWWGFADPPVRLLLRLGQRN